MATTRLLLVLGYINSSPRQKEVANEFAFISWKVLGETMRHYRGKRVDNGEWVYGSLVNFPNGQAGIIPDYSLQTTCDGQDWDFHYEYVIPKTVGQTSGAVDRNEKEIFDGDILNNNFVVYFTSTFKWMVRRIDWENNLSYPFYHLCDFCGPCAVITGSVHDEVAG